MLQSSLCTRLLPSCILSSCWTRPCVTCLNSVIHPFSSSRASITIVLCGMGIEMSFASHRQKPLPQSAICPIWERGEWWRIKHFCSSCFMQIFYIFFINLKRTLFKYSINLKFKFARIVMYKCTYIPCSDWTINLIETICIKEKKKKISDICHFVKFCNVSEALKCQSFLNLLNIHKGIPNIRNLWNSEIKTDEPFWHLDYIHIFMYCVFDLIYFDIHIHVCVDALVQSLN